MNNTKRQQIAERIYSNFFGHLDDSPFQDEKTQEILDWLGTERISIKDAIAEWGEYDAREIKRQAPPKGDTTQRTRQSRRRQRLNEVAQDTGWASWSEFETATINAIAVLPHKTNRSH